VNGRRTRLIWRFDRDRYDQPGKPYDFAPGKFYALDSNAVIKENQSQFSGAHSDIRHPEVAWAVVSAAGLGH
jgi:hypothetical protein